jgi:hypothetical protein
VEYLPGALLLSCLQQGKPVSDVAYFYGEEAPATVPFWKKIDPAQPVHYDFDYVNADVLLHGYDVPRRAS